MTLRTTARQLLHPFLCQKNLIGWLSLSARPHGGIGDYVRLRLRLSLTEEIRRRNETLTIKKKDSTKKAKSAKGKRKSGLRKDKCGVS